MKRNAAFRISAALLILALLILAGCKAAPAAEPTSSAPGEATSSGEQPSTETPEESSAALDIYRIAILEDMTTINIWNLWGPGASAWNYLVRSGFWPALLELSEKRFDLVTDLAADFPTPVVQEGDFYVSTIALKPGAFWSDGVEITADDVLFTAQVVKDFDLSGNWDYADLAQAEAVDRYTVKFFYATKPGLAVYQYGLLQNPIVSKTFWEPEVVEAYAALSAIAGLDPESEEYAAGLAEAQQILYGLDSTGEPAYGPYLFQRWEVGAFVENVANADFFRGGALVEEFANGAFREEKSGVYEFVAYGDPEGDLTASFIRGPHTTSVVYSLYNQDAAVLALMNGEVDYIYNPNGYGPGLKAQIGGDADLDMVINPRNGFRFLSFNFLHAPMDDLAVREAIACMIDNEFLTQSILQAAALPIYSPVPEALDFWYNPDVTRVCQGLSEKERMEWAVQRLQEAGYSWDKEPSWDENRGGSVDWGEGIKMPDGQYVPELLLLAPSPGYDPLRATTGVIVEQYAGMLGFPVRAQLTNFNNILAETLGGGGNWDMVISGWTLGGPSFPDYMCDFFLEEHGGVFAFTGFSNAELSDLCVQFKATSDMEEARQISFRMQEILTKELPYLYLFATQVQDAFDSTRVKFPYLEALEGIEGEYGLPDLVVSAE
jgi:peptide/nickel transport system substrate-binding protein